MSTNGRKGRGESSHNKSKTDAARGVSASLIEEVFDHWKLCMQKKRAVLDVKRRRDIGWAIATYGIDGCKEAIEGCAGDRWWMGANSRKTAYNDISVIFRDSDHVEKFIEMYEKQRAGSSKQKWLKD